MIGGGLNVLWLVAAAVAAIEVMFFCTCFFPYRISCEETVFFFQQISGIIFYRFFLVEHLCFWLVWPCWCCCCWFFLLLSFHLCAHTHTHTYFVRRPLSSLSIMCVGACDDDRTHVVYSLDNHELKREQLCDELCCNL